jgi:hypothetical protein
MSNVVGFAEGRDTAFVAELLRLDAEFESRRASVNAWPAYWFDSLDHMIRAQGQGFLIAEVQRAEKQIAAARRYGADPQYFEAQLKRWMPPTWDRLKHCAPKDWDNPVIAYE